eukprot:CAMPEP_0113583026 /NCGR_PEP_ID=MMETSP0015_2-20120614/32264_1 /TAXON_ID=2838 /ORGANISM="Odontella" /LENGTH=95 /DNA_ID=CAMNT_0000487809 /DNA_START=146 /DNA_END=428 /DNA_ORIENTATION=+ /assembly_acc=CAM_ASM_000160
MKTALIPYSTRSQGLSPGDSSADSAIAFMSGSGSIDGVSPYFSSSVFAALLDLALRLDGLLDPIVLPIGPKVHPVVAPPQHSTHVPQVRPDVRIS